MTTPVWFSWHSRKSIIYFPAAAPFGLPRFNEPVCTSLHTHLPHIHERAPKYDRNRQNRYQSQENITDQKCKLCWHLWMNSNRTFFWHKPSPLGTQICVYITHVHARECQHTPLHNSWGASDWSIMVLPRAEAAARPCSCILKSCSSRASMTADVSAVIWA